MSYYHANILGVLLNVKIPGKSDNSLWFTDSRPLPQPHLLLATEFVEFTTTTAQKTLGMAANDALVEIRNLLGSYVHSKTESARFNRS